MIDNNIVQNKYSKRLTDNSGCALQYVSSIIASVSDCYYCFLLLVL